MNSLGWFRKANKHRKCVLRSWHLDFRELSIVKLLNCVAGQGAVQHEVSFYDLMRDVLKAGMSSVSTRPEQWLSQKKKQGQGETEAGDLIAKYINDL